MGQFAEFKYKKLRISMALGLTTVLLVGCSVKPESLTSQEVQDRVQEDQTRIFSDQEMVYAPISFDQAVARALKYNLDYRLKLMESAQNSGLLDVANSEMLPNLVASAGYTDRSNLSGTYSYDIVDGTAIDEAKDYTGSTDSGRRTAGVELSWNILDFGVSYYRAKQQANQVMIAEERRRRVVQTILRDVRSAYWRAVGAQRLEKRSAMLMDDAKSALAKSKEAEVQGLVSPKEALAFQRVMLDAINLLSARRQGLAYAKRELAALMNITPGAEFTLQDNNEPALRPVPLNINELEEMALMNRPELRMEDYQARITADEAKKQLLSLFPNLSFNAGINYDSNGYLYNNNWLETSSQLTFNLAKVFAIPSIQKAGEGQKKVDDLRRMALSMAIITQVSVAIERYQGALEDFMLSQDSSQVDQRMAAYSRAGHATKTESQMELIRAEARALNSDYKRYDAYAAAQAAFGQIYASLGLDVVPPNVEQLPIDELAIALDGYISRIEDETFFHFEKANKTSVNVNFELSMPSLALNKAQTKAVLDNLTEVLAKNQINPLQAETDMKLHMVLAQDPPANGLIPSHWHVTLTRSDGQVLGEAQYSSSMLAGNDLSMLKAFSEAAVIANVTNVTRWAHSVDDQ